MPKGISFAIANDSLRFPVAVPLLLALSKTLNVEKTIMLIGIRENIAHPSY
jgi:hypothetical protein